MRLGAALALFVPLAAGAAAHAGPLAPPSGPVSETGRFGPRTEISQEHTPGNASSLYVISLPGSYYLSENLNGVNAKNGIEIAASNVSIDLNGFDVRGLNPPPPLAGESLNGITANSSVENIYIHNGTIRDWGGEGIDLVVNSDSVRIENLRVENNKGGGIWAWTNAHIVGCITRMNEEDGIRVDSGSLVFGCTAVDNQDDGIEVRSNSVIRNCVSARNGRNGISILNGSLVEGSVSEFNGMHGIDGGTSGVVAHCVARQNGLNGVDLGIGATVSNSQASSNDENGIEISAGLITDCASYNNGGTAIIGTVGVAILGCQSARNFNGGIRVGDDCLVLNNVSEQDGLGGSVGAGVRATGLRNRIEGNICNASDIGFDIDNAGNLIIRNSAFGNVVNFDVAAGNRYGPIVDLSGGVPPPVLGNSAPSVVLTTDPWANFAR